MDPNNFDAIHLAQLRSKGGLKWSLYPDAIGAFIAEMDFGTAPVVTQALHAAVDVQIFGYLPPALAESMSETSASWHRMVYGWDIAADQVHPIADVIKGLEIAIEH